MSDINSLENSIKALTTSVALQKEKTQNLFNESVGLLKEYENSIIEYAKALEKIEVKTKNFGLLIIVVCILLSALVLSFFIGPTYMIIFLVAALLIGNMIRSENAARKAVAGDTNKSTRKDFYVYYSRVNKEWNKYQGDFSNSVVGEKRS
jgi:hypothetical protein